MTAPPTGNCFVFWKAFWWRITWVKNCLLVNFWEIGHFLGFFSGNPKENWIYLKKNCKNTSDYNFNTLSAIIGIKRVKPLYLMKKLGIFQFLNGQVRFSPQIFPKIVFQPQIFFCPRSFIFSNLSCQYMLKYTFCENNFKI